VSELQLHAGGALLSIAARRGAITESPLRAPARVRDAAKRVSLLSSSCGLCVARVSFKMTVEKSLPTQTSHSHALFKKQREDWYSAAVEGDYVEANAQQQHSDARAQEEESERRLSRVQTPLLRREQYSPSSWVALRESAIKIDRHAVLCAMRKARPKFLLTKRRQCPGQGSAAPYMRCMDMAIGRMLLHLAFQVAQRQVSPELHSEVGKINSNQGLAMCAILTSHTNYAGGEDEQVDTPSEMRQRNCVALPLWPT
jgi:hypothetical protein